MEITNRRRGISLIDDSQEVPAPPADTPPPVISTEPTEEQQVSDTEVPPPDVSLQEQPAITNDEIKSQETIAVVHTQASPESPSSVGIDLNESDDTIDVTGSPEPEQVIEMDIEPLPETSTSHDDTVAVPSSLGNLTELQQHVLAFGTECDNWKLKAGIELEHTYGRVVQYDDKNFEDPVKKKAMNRILALQDLVYHCNFEPSDNTTKYSQALSTMNIEHSVKSNKLAGFQTPYFAANGRLLFWRRQIQTFTKAPVPKPFNSLRRKNFWIEGPSKQVPPPPGHAHASMNTLLTKPQKILDPNHVPKVQYNRRTVPLPLEAPLVTQVERNVNNSDLVVIRYLLTQEEATDIPGTFEKIKECAPITKRAHRIPLSKPIQIVMVTPNRMEYKSAPALFNNLKSLLKP